jgi:hypothetical protein
MTKITRCYHQGEVENTLEVMRRKDGLYDVSLAKIIPWKFIAEVSAILRLKDLEAVYKWAKILEASNDD